MPHCIIEYSDVLEAQVPRAELLNTVHQAVEHSGLFNVTDIRSRTLAFEHYRLGANKHNFLHVTVKLLPGRTDEQKTHLTQSIIDALQQLSLSDTIISCECIEIHAVSYQRASL